MFSRTSILALSLLALAACSGAGTANVPAAGRSVAGNTSSSAQCFTGGGSTCSVDRSTGTFTFTMVSGSYAGAYLNSSHKIIGQTVSQLTLLSFDLQGPGYNGGAQYVSVQTSGGTFFVYPASCTSVNAGSGPLVNVTNAVTQSGICFAVNGATYVNSWSQVLAVYGNDTITAIPDFVVDIGSTSGQWTLSNTAIQ